MRDGEKEKYDLSNQSKNSPSRKESQAAIVHFNFRARSTFPVPVCTVLHGYWVNKADNQQD